MALPESVYRSDQIRSDLTTENAEETPKHTEEDGMGWDGMVP